LELHYFFDGFSVVKKKAICINYERTLLMLLEYGMPVEVKAWVKKHREIETLEVKQGKTLL